MMSRKKIFRIVLGLTTFCGLAVFLTKYKNLLLNNHITAVAPTVRLGTESTEISKSKEFKVPNIVHYIWYNEKSIEFRFDQALSVLTAVKYIKPDAVYFHTNMEPNWKHYEMLKNISIFKVIQRKPPKDVLKRIYHETDYSDYDKVKVLIERGGIYLDFDVMVTRPFEDLRQYPCTVGFQSGKEVCSGVIVCSKEHPFLYLWLDSYYEDFRQAWAYNSGQVSSKLVQRYPDIIHVEKTKLHVPSWTQLEEIWGTTIYNWRDNYTIHTWIRKAINGFLKADPTPESIKTMNSTYGQMARTVYYGSQHLIYA